MRQLLFFIVLLFPGLKGYSQSYIPMPTDSATWRYRIADMSNYTQIVDNMLYTNGKDTNLNGNTYHKVYSRSFNQFGPSGFNPPMVSCYASADDIFYGGIRESGKQVFRTSGTGEKMIFDFNANIGDFIPAYSGTIKVTGIDSIVLSGTYHKRYLTTDTGYSVIEGVGSSRGLLPNINDGAGGTTFICFVHNFVTYSPNAALPCTYVYPYRNLAVTSLTSGDLPSVDVYPVPACDIIHVSPAAGSEALSGVVTDCLGRISWAGAVNEQIEIPVSSWPKGVYFIRFSILGKGSLTKKLVVN
jgi:hypothetical protein